MDDAAESLMLLVVLLAPRLRCTPSSEGHFSTSGTHGTHCSCRLQAPEVLNKPSAEEVFHQVLYNGMSEEELPQYDEKADGEAVGV